MGSVWQRRLTREVRFLREAARDPKMIERRARRVVSPRVLYLDHHHDPHRSLLLIGSPRSGTTWLAELLVEALHCRFVFEPLRVKSVPWASAVRPGLFLDPHDTTDKAAVAVLDRVVSGRIRNRFTDKFNTVYLPRCRLVKEVRLTNLLPWMAHRYPGTPVIYLLRHPIPNAWSVVELGWNVQFEQFLAQPALMEGPLAPFHSVIRAAAESSDPFQRTVLHWCLENIAPITLLDPGRVHVVFYEQLVDDPRGEFERLGVYLSRFDPLFSPVHAEAASVTSLNRPSHSNHRGTAFTSGSDRLDRWRQEVSAERIEQALVLVHDFGLDRIYSAATRPMLSPESVLLGGADATPKP